MLLILKKWDDRIMRTTASFFKCLFIISLLLVLGLTASPHALHAQARSKVMLSAPLIQQLPELGNGCEITSLAMLLQFSGVKKSKMDLAAELKRDPTPVKYGKNGQISVWGDPNQGFVGDITGKTIGYSVYHKPLLGLLKRYKKSAVDLTGGTLYALEKKLKAGYPVVVWTTADYQTPAAKLWRTWVSPTGKIKATFSEHCVLLVGFDLENVYINDPLSNKKQLKIDKKIFLSGWYALGKQAISYGN
jgi:uncharacterized protein YvpB